jgi:sugar O-acyltransferase (sialic acid O-acetyltransferase NeuD family)
MSRRSWRASQCGADPRMALIEIGRKEAMLIVPRIVFYGASGHSYAIVHVLTCLFRHPVCEPAAYIDDIRGGRGEFLNGVPIVSFEEWKNNFLDLASIVNVANPGSRRRLVEKISRVGGSFARLYEQPEFSYPGVSIDAGTLVPPADICYIGSNTTFGKHVVVMPMCSIGHDVIVKDYVTLCPSCTVSGYVVIEEEVYVGAGATIVNGKPGRPLIVGSGTKISAGAVVTKSTPPNAIVAGNPARPLRELARAKRTSK